MTKRTRTILFIICILLFLLAAPSVVLYSQGYRFDFEEKKVVQTGAFYFKVLPRSAEVYFTPLDGKNLTGRDEKFKKTSAFTGAILIENLLPKAYEIEIKKPAVPTQEGYYSWQKKLEIKEKQVTEAKNIVLIPKNPTFTLVSQNPKEINNIISEIAITATSSDKKKIVDFNDYEIWVSFLEVQYDQPQRGAQERVFLTRFSEKICQVLWLNNHYLIFSVGGKIRTPSPDGSENLVFSPCSNIKIIETDDRDRINIVTLAEFKNPEIFWSETDKKLYVLSEEKLYFSESLLK